MLSVIIPVYNEEGAVENIIRRTDSALANNYEIIVVNDGSTDNTQHILQKISFPSLRIVQHKKNRGNGAAIKTGLEIAKGTWVATIDADNTYHPEDLPRLFTQVQQKDVDMIVGFREDLTKGPFFHRTARNLLKKWAEFCSKQQIADINSGLRICKTSLIKKYTKFYPNRFSLHIVLMVCAGIEKAHILYEPIPYGPRIGMSKLSPGCKGVWNFTKFMVLIPTSVVRLHWQAKK